MSYVKRKKDWSSRENSPKKNKNLRWNSEGKWKRMGLMKSMARSNNKDKNRQRKISKNKTNTRKKKSLMVGIEMLRVSMTMRMTMMKKKMLASLKTHPSIINLVSFLKHL